MRGFGRRQEFNHQLKRMLEASGEVGTVITTNPNQIQKDLALLDTPVDYVPVYEGLKGISLNDPRRKEGYKPKIIGYTFKIT